MHGLPKSLNINHCDSNTCTGVYAFGKGSTLWFVWHVVLIVCPVVCGCQCKVSNILQAVECVGVFV